MVNILSLVSKKQIFLLVYYLVSLEFIKLLIGKDILKKITLLFLHSSILNCFVMNIKNILFIL